MIKVPPKQECPKCKSLYLWASTKTKGKYLHVDYKCVDCKHRWKGRYKL